MEASDFYTGLVAELYSPLRSADPEPEPYARFIARHGEPALELGCGDGDPLLDLRRRGIDVEGVDSSADMLDRLRRRADALGLDVVVHHQRMQDLDLGRRFRSIFLAGPTFCLLPDDGAAIEALAAIGRHLEPGGSALIPLFVPEPLAPDAIGTPIETATGGSVLRFTVTGEDRDDEERRLARACRYEAVRPDGSVEVADREWLLHWYTPSGFRSLAAAVGLDVASARALDGAPATEDAELFIVRLVRSA